MIKWFINFVFLFVLASCGGHGYLKDANNLEEAKATIDYYIKSYDKSYYEKCNQVRNSTTKQKFAELAEVMLSLENCGEKCVKLDYETQIKVQQYVTEQLNSHPHLKKLLYFGTIECW